MRYPWLVMERFEGLKVDWIGLHDLLWALLTGLIEKIRITPPRGPIAVSIICE
jgi:hypothetical protein